MSKKIEKNLRFLTGSLTSSSIVVDVGGHHGKWCIPIAKKYNCVVFVFEPCPKNLAILRERVDHPKTTIISKAVSDHTGNSSL